MEQKTTETTEARQPRPVHYEPDHTSWDEKSVRLALKIRGYKLTRDEDTTGARPAVLVLADGTLQVEEAGRAAALDPVEAYPSAGAYGDALADFFDGADTPIPPGAREPHYHLTSPLAEQAGNLHYYVGAWADRPPVDDPTPQGMYFHGCRGKAVDAIDLMLDQLHELRAQLTREGRRHEDELMDHLDAKYGKPGESR